MIWWAFLPFKAWWNVSNGLFFFGQYFLSVVARPTSAIISTSSIQKLCWLERETVGFRQVTNLRWVFCYGQKSFLIESLSKYMRPCYSGFLNNLRLVTVFPQVQKWIKLKKEYAKDWMRGSKPCAVYLAPIYFFSYILSVFLLIVHISGAIQPSTIGLAPKFWRLRKLNYSARKFKQFFALVVLMWNFGNSELYPDRKYFLN